MFKMDKNYLAPEDPLDVFDIQKLHAGYSVSMLVNIE